jgi:L-aspartate oxidase
VLDPLDSLELHLADTLEAGAGLSDEVEAAELVAAAPGAIASLLSLGGKFDTTHLGLEGGHSKARITHAGGDASGAEVYRVLREAVAAAKIETLEFTVAIDLLLDSQGRVVGLVAGGMGGDGELNVGVIDTTCVVLASGGLGQVYTTSTNPAGATGDGLALAARAGAEISNIEFVQFHPTVIYLPGRAGQTPLLTEALRGAGAHIVDSNGNSVMAGQDPRGDLAPRDVVSITMYRRMQSDGLANLWLNAAPIGAARLGAEFPSMMKVCHELGIDPMRSFIPVAPGAHYSCGGIRSNLSGDTSIPGLYAIGEVACTGVHGANRLASNSLTEAIVSGQRVGRALGIREVARSGGAAPVAVGSGVFPGVRTAMAAATSAGAGVLRSATGLANLLGYLGVAPVADTTALTLDVLEATNLHTTSTLIAYGAQLRQESRGCHRRSDFPYPLDAWQHPTVIQAAAGGLRVVSGLVM